MFEAHRTGTVHHVQRRVQNFEDAFARSQSIQRHLVNEDQEPHRCEHREDIRVESRQVTDREVAFHDTQSADGDDDDRREVGSELLPGSGYTEHAPGLQRD